MSLAAPPRTTSRTIRVVELLTKRDLGGAQLTALEAAVPSDDGSGPCRVELWVGIDDDSDGGFDDWAHRNGVDVSIVPDLHRQIAPLGDLRCVARLRNELRRAEADVVHTHSSKAGVLGRLAAWGAGVPVVHTVHGWSFHDAMHPVALRSAVQLERALARITHTLIVVTPDDRARGLALGIGRPEQYQLVRSGLRLDHLRTADRAAARRRLGLRDDTTVVGTVARLAPQKDPMLLLDAFEVLQRTRPDLELVLIGDGPLHDAVAGRVAATRGVHFPGAIADAGMLTVGFDAFVMTSRFEGLPRTMVEAMACRTPVVAPTISGVTELIDDGRSGYLFEERTAAAVATGIERALDDPDRPAVVDEAARRTVDFDVTTMRAALRALWTRTASGDRSR